MNPFTEKAGSFPTKPAFLKKNNKKAAPTIDLMKQPLWSFGGFFILLLFSSHILFSQKGVSGLVLDAVTQQPIPFVNIGIKKLSTGTVTDEKGQFTLQADQAKPNDMVTISALGYANQEVSWAQLMKKRTIALQARPYKLQGIELSAKKLLKKEVVIGNDQTKRDHSVGFGSSQLGTEIAALLPIEKETWIKSAHFVVNRSKSANLLFRLNIYEVEEGRIGNNLVPENILVNSPTEKGVLEIDLSAYNLYVQKDILLSLQWVKDYDGEGEVLISFNANKAGRKNNLYMKTTSVSDFEKVSESMRRAPKYAICFYITGQQVE